MKKFFILFCIFFLSFCASKPPKKPTNPADLYVEGLNLLNRKKYDQAIEKFKLIRENFPFDPIAAIATVKLGDAYFMKKDYLSASTIYEDFFKLYPEDENIPHVLSRLGESFDRISLPYDRDQQYTYKAIEYFTYLKNRFPDHPLSREAEERLKALRDKLAEREYHIGEFYFRTKRFIPAIWRFEYLLKNFPQYKKIDKVIFYLSLSYKELGNVEKAQYYFKLLKEKFPDSPYGKIYFGERKKLEMIKLAAFQEEVKGEKKEEEIDLRGESQELSESQKGGMEPIKIDKRKPIEITSDSMEGFDEKRYILFKGNVLVKQENLFLLTDELHVYLDEKKDEVKKAFAKGNVKILQEEKIATAKEAFFDNEKGEIILKGDVVVFSGSDRLKGDEIIYYIEEKKVTVKGEKSKKASVIFTPKSK